MVAKFIGVNKPATSVLTEVYMADIAIREYANIAESAQKPSCTYDFKCMYAFSFYGFCIGVSRNVNLFLYSFLASSL